MNREEIIQAKKLLEASELVAIPTETVYGIAANAFDINAINKIYKVKNRPLNNPLIVHLSSSKDIFNVAKSIPDVAQSLIGRYWPGPLTLVLPKNDDIPDEVTSRLDTVGVRVPNHPMTLELLQSIDFPLVAPSANRSNHISPTKAAHVASSLGGNAPFIMDGGSCTKGIESTILGFEEGRVVLYRHGAISKEDIEAFIGEEVIEKTTNEKPITPGNFKKHYSPDTKTILSDNPYKILKELDGVRVGTILMNDPKDIIDVPFRCLSMTGDLKEVSRNLYDALHEFDQMDLELILVERAPYMGLGYSINDRLLRAVQ